MTHADFRKFQARMDEVGLITCISRSGRNGSKRYEVLVNGEVLKKYKSRRSAKKFLLARYCAKLMVL